MTPEQAREVLRAVAEHAAEKAIFLYGLENCERAAALIREALIVDRATPK